MACISSFFQDILWCFDTVLNLPVGLGIPWRRFNLFRLVVGGKLLKLSTVELWAVVCGESVWKTISYQMRFQLVNNCSSCCRRQYIQLEEIRRVVSCNQVLGTIELEQVWWDALPWSFRYFVTFQRFFLTKITVKKITWNQLFFLTA